MLSRLGIHTVLDLLCHLPARYEDRRAVTPIGDLRRGASAGSVIAGSVEGLRIRPARARNVRIATFHASDRSGRVAVTLFGGPRSFHGLSDGASVALYGVPEWRGGGQGIPELRNPDWAVVEERRSPGRDAGDARVVQMPAGWGRLLPVYPTVNGLPRKLLAGMIYDCVTSPDLALTDPLPPEILKKRGFPPLRRALMGVHAPQDTGEIEPSRARLAYQELYEIQRNIREAGRERRKRHAPSLAGGAGAADELARTLPFGLTPYQRDAIGEISADMCAESPMHRLLQGDVGAGKTLVALCAVLQCVRAGYGAAVLVPTTVLCEQFFSECAGRLAPLGVRCAMITGGTRQGERARLIESLRGGETDVLVGTHALLSPGMECRSLGLVVIDEQHRFGVRQRAQADTDPFVAGALFPHTLMMSATPIPRTLCLALYGDVETTVLRGKPPGRAPVVTKLVSSNHTADVYRFLLDRVRAGERCCWVCRAVGDEDGSGGAGTASVVDRALDIERELARKLPGVRAERLHGRMKPEEKASAIARFRDGSSLILVSTTVIEVGIDIPEASVIVIEGASRYGLSQLHQMRGRVGRGARAGVCLLLDAAADIKRSRRLEILVKCGDGFEIAEEDLRLRGAGELDGLRQHGRVPLRAATLPRDSALLDLARADLGAQRSFSVTTRRIEANRA